MVVMTRTRRRKRRRRRRRRKRPYFAMLTAPSVTSWS
jgi:hypothetical protein